MLCLLFCDVTGSGYMQLVPRLLQQSNCVLETLQQAPRSPFADILGVEYAQRQSFRPLQVTNAG